MNKLSKYTALSFFILLLSLTVQAQKDFSFEGQLSSWGHYNFDNYVNTWFGGRYIPEINYKKEVKENKLLDFEVSANIYGSLGMHPFDTATTDGKIKPYRAWVRYSTEQFELRAGLQKINFGSANMLRPLMWFDRIDPRDPLQLTDGVWGLLGRYYFLNNANLWVWGLYGNKNTKGWEVAKTNKKYPEVGGRLQLPTEKGEIAATYHFRVADSRELDGSINSYSKIPENRIAIDGKWDMEVGLWLEGAWIAKSKDVGMFTHQEILNLGVDYTFGLGNGLTVIFEQLLASYDEKAFEFSNTLSFSGLSLSYPLGLFDSISGIVYYDWTNESLYNFVNWQKQFDNISLYLMAYWNPKQYKLPLQGGQENLFSGKGLQVMVVFNY